MESAAMWSSESGRRLRGLRIARGLRQADLAGEDLSAAYVSMLERGRRRPSSRVLQVLGARLGVDTLELLGRASEEPPALGVDRGDVRGATAAARDDEVRSALTRASTAWLVMGELETALRSAETVLGMLSDQSPPSPVALTQAYLASAQAQLALDAREDALDSIRQAQTTLEGVPPVRPSKAGKLAANPPS